MQQYVCPLLWECFPFILVYVSVLVSIAWWTSVQDNMQPLQYDTIVMSESSPESDSHVQSVLKMIINAYGAIKCLINC